MKSTGLVEEFVPYNPGTGKFPRWEELDEENQKSQSRKMEIYAAMILTIILQQYIVKAHVAFNIAYEEISFKKTFKIISQFIFFFDFFHDSLLLENLLLHLIANSSQKKRPNRSFKRVFYRKIKAKSNKWK